MFPFRYSSIFRSRWMALLWSAGIVWMAVDVAGTPEDANQSATADNGVTAAAAALDAVNVR